MKKYIIRTVVVLSVAIAMASCKEDHPIYDGKSYTMFSDTLTVCPVTKDNKEFEVKVAVFTAEDYDRTYAVEVVPSASSAVLFHHYTIENSTVVIRANETVSSVKVKPVYDNFADTDTLSFRLKLVSQLNDKWSDEGSTIRVSFKKICPFDINDYVGWCRVTCKFLMDYYLLAYKDFYCEKVEGETNTLLMKGLFDKNYDVKIKFDFTDPLKPTIKMTEPHQIADTRDIMSFIWGDGRVLMRDQPGYVSSFNSCSRTATQYMSVYVDNVGIVGNYTASYRWIEEWELD